MVHLQSNGVGVIFSFFFPFFSFLGGGGAVMTSMTPHPMNADSVIYLIMG